MYLHFSLYSILYCTAVSQWSVLIIFFICNVMELPWNMLFLVITCVMAATNSQLLHQPHFSFSLKIILPLSHFGKNLSYSVTRNWHFPNMWTVSSQTSPPSQQLQVFIWSDRHKSLYRVSEQSGPKKWNHGFTHLNMILLFMIKKKNSLIKFYVWTVQR